MRNRFQFLRANRFQVSKILTHGDDRRVPAPRSPTLRLYGKVGIMNALPSTMIKWLGLGLGLWAAVDCSAEASSPPPTQGTHPGSSGSGGPGGPLAMAGRRATGTAGTVSTGTAGTASTGTAGTASSGTAGTASTG